MQTEQQTKPAITNLTRISALLLPAILGAYLLFSSTTNLFNNLSVYDAKRVVELVLLFLVFLWAFAVPAIRQSTWEAFLSFPKAIKVGIGIFFLLGALSSVVNADTIRGLVYSFWDVALLGFVFVLALIIAGCRVIAGKAFDYLTMGAITLLGLAVGFQEFSGFWMAWLAGYEFSFDIALPYFYHPRNYNQLQTWTIPVLTALPLLFQRHRLAITLCILTLGLHWFVLLETGARGSIVSLSVAFLLASLLNATARKAIFRWQLTGLILGTFMYLACLTVAATTDRYTLFDKDRVTTGQNEAIPTNVAPPYEVTEFSKDKGSTDSFFDKSVGRPLMHTTGRTRLWKAALAYSKANPVWGIGPMNFSCDGPVWRVGSPHNFGFQVLSEWGIPATLILGLLSLFLFWTLIKSLRTNRENPEDENLLRLMLATALIAAMMHLMVSSLLLTPASQIGAALICGWLIGLVSSTKSPIQSDSKSETDSSGTALSYRNKPKGLAATFLILILLSGSSAVLGVHELSNMQNYLEQRPGRDQMMSRFWQMGRACHDAIKWNTTSP